MRQQITSPGRRRFCTGIAAALLVLSVPMLPGCNSFQPRPFATGKTVTPPKGCSELLKRDPRGDC